MPGAPVSKPMSEPMSEPLLILAGPTAVGKTEVALELAALLGAEILSVVSRQVFRALDIGTAKPNPSELSRIPHHLIDLIDVTESLSAGAFRAHFERAEVEVRARGRMVLAVGGSGLYLRAVTHGLFEGSRARLDLREAWAARSTEDLRDELHRADPETAARLEARDRQRIVRALEVFHDTGVPLSRLHRERPGRGRPFRLVVLTRNRPDLYERVNRRVDAMALAGLEDEARRLWEMRLPPESGAMRTVGYREWFEHFEGRTDRAAALEAIRMHSRQYAKRQLTWFRGQPEAIWLEVGESETPAVTARRAMPLLAPGT